MLAYDVERCNKMPADNESDLTYSSLSRPSMRDSLKICEAHRSCTVGHGICEWLSQSQYLRYVIKRCIALVLHQTSSPVLKSSRSNARHHARIRGRGNDAQKPSSHDSDTLQRHICDETYSKPIYPK